MSQRTQKFLFKKNNIEQNSGFSIDSNGDIIVNNSDSFPFILIQSGIADNIQIGQTNPSVGTFTTLISSTFSTFDNFIRLGNPNENLHGILLPNDNYFFGSTDDGIDKSFTFRNNLTNTLLPANFSRLNLGDNGVNQVSVSTNTDGDIILEPGTNGDVILPKDTNAYRPYVNHVNIIIADPDITYTANLSNDYNVEYISISGSVSNNSTINLVLPNPLYSGFIKTIFVENIPNNVSVSCQVLIRQFSDDGTIQNRSLDFIHNGSSIQLIYDMIHNCWCFLDTGCCVS